MNRMALVISRIGSYDEAIAKITAKKNKTATAIPPNTVINFITICFVRLEDLNLVPVVLLV